MAREADALAIRPWAASGDRVKPENSTPALDRSVGYPASFSQVGGNQPSREEFNQFRYEITLMLHEINRFGGVLEWTGAVAHPGYLAGALAQGSDGVVYRAVRDSSGVDPTTDATNVDWNPLLAGVVYTSTLLAAINAAVGNTVWQTGGTPATVVDASTSTRGIIEIANEAEHNALADVLRAVVPGRIPISSATQRGLVELASGTETNAGTDGNRAVTPSGLNGRTATTSRRGLVELATQPEVNAGTDDEKAVTPATLEDRLSSLFISAGARILLAAGTEHDFDTPQDVAIVTELGNDSVTVTLSDGTTTRVLRPGNTRISFQHDVVRVRTSSGSVAGVYRLILTD